MARIPYLKVPKRKALYPNGWPFSLPAILYFARKNKEPFPEASEPPPGQLGENTFINSETEMSDYG